MILIHKNGASFYQFEKLNPFSELQHGIFTRHFGHSRGKFDSLNVAYGLGDADDCVRENRRVIARAMQNDDLIYAKQVHEDQVLILSADNSARADNADSIIGTGDALVTDLPGKFLTIQVADCQSILLFEPKRRVIANIHSGWRGSIRNIAGRTVDIMQKHFKCRPADMIAGIGPSLGPCCAEFIHYRNEMPERLWRYKKADHCFDFWAISRDQLICAGILSENIEFGNMCTRCNTEIFFSYRGERKTGRFASVIGLVR